MSEHVTGRALGGHWVRLIWQPMTSKPIATHGGRAISEPDNCSPGDHTRSRPDGCQIGRNVANWATLKPLLLATKLGLGQYWRRGSRHILGYFGKTIGILEHLGETHLWVFKPAFHIFTCVSGVHIHSFAKISKWI